MKRLLFMLVLLSGSCYAVDSRQLSDPKQQESYETLTKELRCLVCQNQIIAESNAELASDLRRQVSEMLAQGKSKEEIIQFMTDRYGDFVLYKPAFKGKTLLLWIAPIAFLVIGLIAVLLGIRSKKAKEKLTSDTGALQSDTEKQKKIRSLLDNGEVS